MSKTRPPCPPEFRQQMVELVRAGRSVEELAGEFDPSAQAIHNWVAQADREEHRRSDGLTNVVRFPGPGNILSDRVAKENLRIRKFRLPRFTLVE